MEPCIYYRDVCCHSVYTELRLNRLKIAPAVPLFLSSLPLLSNLMTTLTCNTAVLERIRHHKTGSQKRSVKQKSVSTWLTKADQSAPTVQWKEFSSWTETGWSSNCTIKRQKTGQWKRGKDIHRGNDAQRITGFGDFQTGQNKAQVPEDLKSVLLKYGAVILLFGLLS